MRNQRAPVFSAKRLRILAWAVGLAGIALIVQGGKGVLQFLSSQGWPSSPGTIIENSPVLSRTTEFRNGKATTSRSSTVKITYRYDVNDVPHTGNRIGLQDPADDDEAFFERVASDYPLGKPVAVYYDPENPDFAVLERRIGSDGYQTLFGIALAAASVFFLFARRHSRASPLKSAS